MRIIYISGEYLLHVGNGSCCLLLLDEQCALDIIHSLGVPVEDIGYGQGEEERRGYPEPVADEERDIAHQVYIVRGWCGLFWCFHVGKAIGLGKG